jgi:hypothetical protein
MDNEYQCEKVHDGGQAGYVCLASSRGPVAQLIDADTRQTVCTNKSLGRCSHLPHPIRFVKVKPKV